MGRLNKQHRIARQKAIDAGKETYIGIDCTHGHGGERYVSKFGGNCVQCYEYQKFMNNLRGKRYREDNREKAMWDRARQRAIRDGLPFTITVADIKIPDRCPVLGIAMDKPSLDRRRNAEGYIPGNVFVISNKANSWKADMDENDLQKLLNYVRGW